MATLEISDKLGLNLSITPDPASGLAQYLRRDLKVLFTSVDLARFGMMTLDAVPLDEAQLGFTVSEPVVIGIGKADLTIGGGLAGHVSVLREGDNEALEKDLYGDPIQVGKDEALVALGLTANVSADASAAVGDLKFGFQAGSQIELTNVKPFARAQKTTLLDALKQTASEFAIAGDVADLSRMPVGTVCTVDGSGTLQFSASSELALFTNPLASVALPVKSEQIKVTAGGSLALAASGSFTGEYQIRATKKDAATVRLGVYRKKGSEFELSIDVKAGVAASLGKTDLIEKLLVAISANPKADQDQLRAAGLGDDLIDAIESAIKAGVQRKLELTLREELSAADTEDAAFSFDINIAELDAEADRAVHCALDGDFSLIAAERVSPLPGVTPGRTILTRLKESPHALSVNLLGIFNYISVSRLIVEGKVLYEESTGDLLITDKATATSVQASISNLAAAPDKLRTVYAESAMITAAYRGSKMAIGPPALTSAHVSFEAHARTNRQTMKHNLDVPEALGLLSSSQKNALLDGLDDFGRSTSYVETRYDDALAKRLFLRDGKARTQAEYEDAGRNALRLLVQPGDDDDYRRGPAVDQGTWDRMKDLGQFNFRQIFRSASALQLASLVSDYTVILWWAQSMARMATVLEEIERFYAATPNPNPRDNRFTALRDKLADAIKKVVGNTRDQFGDPWGLIAMDQVTFPEAAARVLITSAALSRNWRRSGSRRA